MPFYVQMPDEPGGFPALTPAVVEATILPDDGDPERKVIVFTAPPEIATRWPSVYTDVCGGWMEVPGPARLLDSAEYRALTSAAPRETRYSAIGQQVTCKLCKREYVCIPDDDYFALAGEEVTGPDTGYCFQCLLTAAKTRPGTLVMVIDTREEPGDGQDSQG